METLSVVSIGKLFQDNAERLSLTWLAGQEGEERSLNSGSLHKSTLSPIGHLNLIHPNWIQVLGGPEMDYLHRLSAEALNETMEHLFTDTLAAIVLADGKSAPTVMLDQAIHSGTPLLASRYPSPDVVAHLNHYLTQKLAETTVVHGVFLEVTGIGVLIRGQAAVGKSELALELVTRGHRLVADDAVELRHVARETLEGSCPPMLRDFLEVRGLGILNIRSLFGETAVKDKKNLKLIVELVNPSDTCDPINRLEMEASRTKILEVEIPTVRIPVAAGRNLAVLLEVAVRSHILKSRGINPVEELMARQEILLDKEY